MTALCVGWALWVLVLAWWLARLWARPVRLRVEVEVAQFKVGKPARVRVKAFNEFDVEVPVTAADVAWTSDVLQLSSADADGSVTAVGAAAAQGFVAVSAFGLNVSEPVEVVEPAVARLEIVVEAIP